MAECSAYTMALLGICGLAWSIVDVNMESHYPGSGIFTPICGVYGIVLGVGIHYYEKYVGNSRNGTAIPVRAFMYWMYVTYTRSVLRSLAARSDAVMRSGLIRVMWIDDVLLW